MLNSSVFLLFLIIIYLFTFLTLNHIHDHVDFFGSLKMCLLQAKLCKLENLSKNLWFAYENHILKISHFNLSRIQLCSYIVYVLVSDHPVVSLVLNIKWSLNLYRRYPVWNDSDWWGYCIGHETCMQFTDQKPILADITKI